MWLWPQAADAQRDVGDTPTAARAADGSYVSWREHIIDEPATAGFGLSGSDGLVMADLDNDGHEGIVSVHESDSESDGPMAGNVVSKSVSVFTCRRVPPAMSCAQMFACCAGPRSERK